MFRFLPEAQIHFIFPYPMVLKDNQVTCVNVCVRVYVWFSHTFQLIRTTDHSYSLIESSRKIYVLTILILKGNFL